MKRVLQQVAPAMESKLAYVKPQMKTRSLEMEDMICVSVESSVDPGDFGMGDGGELNSNSHNFNIWED